jgi:hypothetical protein
MAQQASRHSVERVAAAPDDALAPRLDADGAEPLHRGGEVLEEGGAVGGVALGEDPGGRVLPDGGVGGEQAEAVGQVLVVGLVEVPGRDDVVEDGDGGVGAVSRAGALQRARELRVEPRVVAGAPVAVDAGRELGAVGEADGVGAGQRHHLPGREALAGEEAHHGSRRHVGAGQVALDVARVGAAGVAAAQRDGEPGPAQGGHEVARRQRQRVGAGDDARALGLQRRLGAGHGVEGVPGQGEVDLRGALRRGAGGGERRDQHRGVAAVDEAVVEEEPQRARRRGRVGALLGGDGVRHDPLHARAAAAVVVGRQPGRRPRRAAGGRGGEQRERQQELAAARRWAHGRKVAWFGSERE